MAIHSILSLNLLALGLLVLPSAANAKLVQMYCSSQNTASNLEPAFWTWQSNGWCKDRCTDYAFAVVLQNDCWCSDYIPAEQEDVSECSDKCPGYPDELCGHKEDSLYGYVEVNGRPSGTAGSVPTATGKSTKSSSSSTPAPTPITSVQVITESGAIIYKTVTTIPSTPSGQLQNTSSEGGTSTGTIAGAVVGSVGGLALIGGLLFFLLRRRRQQKNEDGEESGTSPKAQPQRHASTLSKSGLLNSEKDYPQVAIPAPTRHSSNGTDGISPTGSSDRRHSKPLFYDQRLNPSALMDLDNGSHTSIATIEDNRDYTRTLNVRNPDPPGN